MQIEDRQHCDGRACSRSIAVMVHVRVFHVFELFQIVLASHAGSGFCNRQIGNRVEH